MSSVNITYILLTNTALHLCSREHGTNTHIQTVKILNWNVKFGVFRKALQRNLKKWSLLESLLKF